MSVSKEEILTALEEMRANSGERGFKQAVDLIINLKDCLLYTSDAADE